MGIHIINCLSMLAIKANALWKNIWVNEYIE